MATVIRRVELKVGELIEVDGRKYEVVPARDTNGVTLEPPITPLPELEKEWGAEPVSKEEFDRLSEGLPRDDEG